MICKSFYMLETSLCFISSSQNFKTQKVLQISYETKLQAILHFLLHYFVYLTTFSARIQDGWWQQDTCFAWSRIKIYCWSWAFCSCIIFLLFLFCTLSNCHGPWAIILYAIPIQFAKYAQVHYKVYNDRHICIHRPFWNFVGSIA